MGLDRETLRSLLDRTYSNYNSLLKSLDKSFHHNLMKVNFLSWQIFPDTASGEFLSMPYSDRVRSYMQAQWLEKPFRQAFPLYQFRKASSILLWRENDTTFTNQTHRQKRFCRSMGEGERISQRLKPCQRWGAYCCYRSWLCSIGGGSHELGDKGLRDSKFWHIRSSSNTGNSRKSD